MVTDRAPTISLVTVCRNSAATIEKTITSILAQKDEDVEYIVVDGASTDNTPAIIESYRTDIDTYNSEEDEGIADAFNKGISLAKGDIVGLINSDDVLAQGALDKIRNFFEAHPTTEVLHGDILLVKGDRIIKKIKPAARWWYPWRLVLIFNHPATFVRQTVYEKYGLYDSSYSIAMDADIFLRWVKFGVRCEYLPEVLVHMQAGGVSGSRGIETFRQHRNALIHNGFSVPAAYFQFLSKVTLWAVLKAASWFRRIQYCLKSNKSTL